MAVFQHVAWGYELTYPDAWIHATLGEVEGFAAIPEALTPDYDGKLSGQVLVRADFNGLGQPIEPIWTRHIGMLAGWLGAKDVGSSDWRIGQAVGLEAEIVLMKKDDRRLWSGILTRRLTILHFIVLHLKEEYEIYQQEASKIIASLRFPQEVAGVLTSAEGLPLPPDFEPIPPQDILDDIEEPARWRAFDGVESIGALQAFFLREAVNYGWTIADFGAYPDPTGPGFARFVLEKKDKRITLGLLPYRSEETGIAQPARIVYKLG